MAKHHCLNSILIIILNVLYGSWSDDQEPYFLFIKLVTEITWYALRKSSNIKGVVRA